MMNLDPAAETSKKRTSRRVLLKRFVKGALGLGCAGLVYSIFEAGWIRVRRITISVPRLPPPFRGTSIAFLADLHHGPFTGLDYVKQVVQLTNTLSPDVVLLDVEMPRMDGFELARHMKNTSTLKHIPIIMITSRTGEKHRQRALSIGVNSYLGKPYQEEELLENIYTSLAEVEV